MILGDPIIFGGSSPSASDAILTVTCPTGSTVTATKCGIMLTPTMWVQAADNTLDCALFVIQPSLFDAQNAWAVTAVLGESSESKTVTISDNKQYDLAFYTPVYLIKNGIKITDFTGQRYTRITQQPGYVNFYVTANAAATFTTTDPVDLTNYRQISITIPNNGMSYYRPGVEPSVIIGNPRPIFSDQDSSTTNTYFALLEMLSSNTTITANTYTLDISNVSGAYYIGVAIGSSASLNASMNISEWVVTA